MTFTTYCNTVSNNYVHCLLQHGIKSGTLLDILIIVNSIIQTPVILVNRKAVKLGPTAEYKSTSIHKKKLHYAGGDIFHTHTQKETTPPPSRINANYVFWTLK